MGIFSDNPVLAREMRGRLRLTRKRGGQTFPWLVAVLMLVIVYFYAKGLAGLFNSPPQDAREFWPLLTFGLLTLIVLLAPALAATAITQEREQQTWESLATTRLTGREILLGKWLARQTIPIVLILLACPYLLGCVLRSGIGLATLAATVAFLVVTSLFYGALGLLCSYQARRTAAATATALTCSALLCIGTYVISGVIAILLGPRSTPVLWLNPFYALTALVNWFTGVFTSGGNQYGYEPYPEITVFYFAVTPILTAAALFFMVSRYRQAVRG